MGIGAALLGGAAISGIGGAISSGNQASAAKSAAKTQADAANAALAQQKATTQQVLGIEQPFVNVGMSAIPGLEALLGATPYHSPAPTTGTTTTNPDGSISNISGSLPGPVPVDQSAMSNSFGGGSNSLTGGASINPSSMSAALAQTPGYQFALQQGLMATQNGFAAQGLPRGGAAIKGAGQYAVGLASGQYQNILQDYYNTVSLGSNAAANFGSAALGGQAAANQLITAAGQATASGTVGAANATAGGINAITGGLGNAATTLALTGGGGLFGSGGGGGGALSPYLNNGTGGYGG